MSDYWLKKRLKKQWLKDNKQYLWNYTPDGYPMYWDIRVVWRGKYDTFTGERTEGAFYVVVKPDEPRRGNYYYGYDDQKKQMWRYLLGTGSREYF